MSQAGAHNIIYLLYALPVRSTHMYKLNTQVISEGLCMI